MIWAETEPRTNPIWWAADVVVGRKSGAERRIKARDENVLGTKETAEEKRQNGLENPYLFIGCNK